MAEGGVLMNEAPPMMQGDVNGQAFEGQQRYFNLSQDPAHEDIIRFLINPEKEIKERMMVFSGFEWNIGMSKWVENPNKRPMLNDEGLKFVKGEFNHILNKFIPQSNLTEKMVEHIIMSYSRRVRRGLVSNMERFGLKKESASQTVADLDQIKNTLTDTAFFILRQPIEDKGRKFIFSPIKQVEHHSFQENSAQPRRSRLEW
jgi:hypothetical protein